MSETGKLTPVAPVPGVRVPVRGRSMTEYRNISNLKLGFGSQTHNAYSCRSSSSPADREYQYPVAVESGPSSSPTGEGCHQGTIDIDPSRAAVLAAPLTRHLRNLISPCSVVPSSPSQIPHQNTSSD